MHEINLDQTKCAHKMCMEDCSQIMKAITCYNYNDILASKCTCELASSTFTNTILNI